MSPIWHKYSMIVSIALLALILIGSPLVSAQDADGVLRGRVANWTEGGGSVGQVEVVLNIYLGDSQVGSTTTTTDGNGTFEFSGMFTEPNYAYELNLVYQEAEYNFEPFSFEEGSADKVANLVVFDSTSSDESISIGQAHVIVNVEQGILNVTEWYLFSNDGDKTYVGSGEAGTGTKEALRFSLPQQATDLELGGELMECCIVETANGFTDTMTVMPGTKEILFSYKVNYESESYTLPVTLHYPVGLFDLMVGGEQVELSCDQLILAEPLGTGSEQYIHYTGQGLTRDTTLDVDLSGLLSSEGKGLSWGVIVAIALAHGVGLSFIILRRRRRRASIPVPSEEDEGLAEREKLLREIAQLDDAFEQGSISEEDYLRQRSQRKDQLIALTRRRRS